MRRNRQLKKVLEKEFRFPVEIYLGAHKLFNAIQLTAEHNSYLQGYLVALHHDLMTLRWCDFSNIT